jgi:hypothetical protein
MPRAGPLPLLARQMLLCLRIYLDTAFFNDLQNKFGGCTDSNACKFSRGLRAGRAGNRTAPWQTGRKRKASAQIQQTTAASAGGISALMLATAGCSVTQEREASSPTVWAERTPLSAIETAFAALDAASAGNAALKKPKTQGSCSDLEYSFLNSSCSTMHKKHVRLTHNRVATFIVGRHGAAEPPAQPATVGEREGLPSSNHVSTNSSGPPRRSVTAAVKANENKREKR